MTTHTTRRTLILGGASSAGLLPMASAAVAAIMPTPIALAWIKAEQLRGKLAAFKSEMGAEPGISPWLNASDEAFALATERYHALLDVLHNRPHNAKDLDIMAAAAKDPDIQAGLSGWANLQVTKASNALRRSTFA